jgi:hypothetical protein
VAAIKAKKERREKVWSSLIAVYDIATQHSAATKEDLNALRESKPKLSGTSALKRTPNTEFTENSGCARISPADLVN